jgi:phage gpG-like protein
MASRKTGRRPGKILTQSRRLARSVRVTSDDEGVEFGVSDLVYAAVHQFGISETRTSKVRTPGAVPVKFTITIPARPYLPINEAGTMDFKDGSPGAELVEEIDATLVDWLNPDMGDDRK